MNKLGFERVESRELLTFGALAGTCLDAPSQTETVTKDEKITISLGRTEVRYAHLLNCIAQENVWTLDIPDGTSNTIMIGEKSLRPS